MSALSFAGQVALVTGASRGIGAAIALELAQQGLKVIGTATSDEGAAKISAALAAFPGCRGANLNVNDMAAAEALIDGITAEHGAWSFLAFAVAVVLVLCTAAGWTPVWIAQLCLWIAGGAS